MDVILVIVLCVSIGLVALALGILIGIITRKRIGERKIGTAEERAKKIEADAKLKSEMKLTE